MKRMSLLSHRWFYEKEGIYFVRTEV